MENNSSTYTINNIERTMRYISGIIKQNGRKILTNYPITSPQFVALQWLVENEELTIGELSNKISLAFSTTTDLVDRMENNELVERVKDVKDKRVVRIRVLDKGRQIIQEVIEKRQVYLGEVLEDFTDEQTESLNELLEFLHEQMRKVNNK
ncbi:MarR family winged helix-turn-helix transcriptional regulator [Virgibacillus sp. SK37]|uniref:MarR family winged helix-turn-helix transcriptional regulator n=1 Tax=Virgibacillus sp. SK37 TaxID=403957 RepID=UPI0004D1669C|nr:MarR family transcriptional regulator [Virgibacillus sp. SK37]AIF43275.1 MarR family transcriptional regulator [Virgibacillus sp. SK37]